MSIKEHVAHEMETLGEKDIQAVAEFVSFLKFRSRASLDDARLASLYSDFAQEDRELAENGISEYAHSLSSEDA